MLTGKKVVLDVIKEQNIEWFRQQRNLPEMRKYYREWKEISSDQQASWYKERGNNTNPNHVYFEIHAINEEDRSDEFELGSFVDRTLVGCIGLHYMDWRLRAGEFSIFIAQDTHGRGLGKDALITLFDYGFKEMNLHKIWAEVFDNNSAIHLYTKSLGMHNDGLLRDTYFCDGKYGNSIMLSMLEDEWLNRK